MTVLLAGLGAAALALSACSGGTGASTASGDKSGSGTKVSSIKLVAAEYS
jgi:multiple sugar transport system substrate-binding protein